MHSHAGKQEEGIILEIEKRHWIEDGFILEKNGKNIVNITNPVYHDMFWRAYTVEYITTDAKDIKKMKKGKFWIGVKFFSLNLKEYVPNAFVALQPFDEDGRLIVRGEYITEEFKQKREKHQTNCFGRFFKILYKKLKK